MLLRILIICILVTSFSKRVLANNFYAEIDVSFQALRIIGSTEREVIDFRAGYQFEKFDISLRYFQDANYLLSGSSLNVDSKDVESSLLGLRAGYFLNDSWLLGLGLGQMEIDYTIKTSSDEISKSPSTNYIEVFISYSKDLTETIFLKFEGNVFVGNRIEVERDEAFSSYDYSDEHSDYLGLIILGYNF